MKQLNHNYDQVVIGSGPGGAITSCVLAENNQNVLLIEKGQSIQPSETNPFTALDIPKMYNHAGLDISIGNTPVKLIQGSVVGGGSEINSGLYHRTPVEILQKWQANYGIKNIDINSTKSLFEENESEISLQHLSQEFPKCSQELIKICKEKKWKIQETPRWINQTSKNDKINFYRYSMSNTYIKRFIKANGTLSAHTTILKIKRNSNQWNLTVKNSNGIRTISCKDLFLTAGSINTPALLLTHKLINKNSFPIYFHPMLKFIVHFNKPVFDINNLVSMHQITEFLPNFIVGGSATTPSYLGLGLMHHQEQLKMFNTIYPYLSNYYISLANSLPGKIKLFPFSKQPIVFYSLSKKDLRLFQEGLSCISSAFLNSSAHHIYVDGFKITPLSKEHTLVSLKQLRKAEYSTVHMMGSCPMSNSSTRGITNSYGKVFDQDNLYINDSSLFCTSIGVNPQGTVMMLAKRNVYNYLGK